MQDKLGPLIPILEDPEVTGVLIDGWEKVYVEKRGQLSDLPTPFKDESEVYAVIEAILTPLGAEVNESKPLADARLADGSLVNVVIPPISLTGPSLTIRKMMNREEITAEKLVEYGSASPEMLTFLRACVLGRLNTLVAGGTASGKTTLLNILSRWIPLDERVIILQKEFDFRLPHRRLVVLETRPANLEGRGEISMAQLVINATRMRPDRILMTEAHGAEAFHMLNALASGHDGGMFTIHAINVRDALARLEVLSGYANPAIPLLSLREQIASGLDVIVQHERMLDGRRRILKIAEITGLQDGVITTRDLFEFRRTGIKGDKIYGTYTATGAIPASIERLQTAATRYGLDFPLSIFTPA